MVIDRSNVLGERHYKGKVGDNVNQDSPRAQKSGYLTMMFFSGIICVADCMCWKKSKRAGLDSAWGQEKE